MFPLSVKNVTIKSPSVSAAIEKLIQKGTPYVGTFMTKDEENERDYVESVDDIYAIGTLSQILRAEKSSEGGLSVLLLPHRRIRVTELLENSTEFRDEINNSTPVSEALVENLSEESHSKRNPVTKALTSEILSVLKELVKLNPQVRDQIALHGYMSGVSLVEEPAQLADFISSHVPFADSSELQSILESLVVEERLQKSLILLKKELLNAKIQAQIDQEVEEKMAKQRKDFYLMEHIKGIQKELGMEGDGREKLVDIFKDRAKSSKMPKAVATVFDEELRKFKTLDPSAIEYASARNYLDWLSVMPWGIVSEDNFNLEEARTILDKDHFGMKDVKERILEFIAVGKLKKSVQGKIICLVGPPGVGKTSIGKSIANTLNREFYRFSVGGMSDVSEIKGHRRTYVGAMPGKLIQALKKTKTENPLILIDEVDKIGQNAYRGDPSSALLEVLDPEQNSTFIDHYLDVPVDLSKTLFVCTANVLDSIPGPLLDRMEVIQLSGYVEQEKKQIAAKHLIPQVRISHSLNEDQLKVQDEALDLLIRDYCRESGVRNLKKQIEKIFRKGALFIAKGEVSDKLIIKKENLHQFAGNPVFSNENLYDIPPPGVAMGLAWTGMGGSVLFMESIKNGEVKGENQKTRLMQTGQMGDVMKESTTIAYTFAKAFLKKIDPTNEFFKNSNIHLHVPEGSIKKDGELLAYDNF
jgi:Lon-like ATP-dependent protease